MRFFWAASPSWCWLANLRAGFGPLIYMVILGNPSIREREEEVVSVPGQVMQENVRVHLQETRLGITTR